MRPLANLAGPHAPQSTCLPANPPAHPCGPCLFSLYFFSKSLPFSGFSLNFFPTIKMLTTPPLATNGRTSFHPWSKNFDGPKLISIYIEIKGLLYDFIFQLEKGYTAFCHMGLGKRPP